MMSLLAVGEPTPRQAGVNLPSLGTLAMSVIHDLRNPLSAILSAAEMLNGSQLSEQQVRRLARNMHNASLRIQGLLENYVDLCRRRESAPRSSNLRKLVADAVDRIAAMADAQSVAVVQDVAADLVVTLDRGRSDSILANLLVNALEAMPMGGSIHISAVAVEDSVVIRVCDTGPGIPPEIRDRLFQRFVTARKPNGWGLGLAQARQVVIDHGGEMWLESPRGKGACIAFSLPAAPPQTRH